MYTFTRCLSVSRSHGTRYSLEDFAPFAPYAEPEMPKSGKNQRLRFRSSPVRNALISLPSGKCVRAELVGKTTDPLWCVIYTRAVLASARTEPGVAVIDVDAKPIALKA